MGIPVFIATVIPMKGKSQTQCKKPDTHTVYLYCILDPCEWCTPTTAVVCMHGLILALSLPVTNIYWDKTKYYATIHHSQAEII